VTFDVQSTPLISTSPSPSPASVPKPGPIFFPIKVALPPGPDGQEGWSTLNITPIWKTIDPSTDTLPGESSLPRVSTHVQSSQHQLEHPTATFSQSDPRLDASSTSGMLAIVIDEQTLLPGYTATIGASLLGPLSDAKVVMGGTTIHLDYGAKHIIINGTMTIPFASTALPQSAFSTLRIGGEVYTADALGRYIVGSQTLVPGGFIMLDQITTSLPGNRIHHSGGHIVFLDPQGKFVVLDGQTTVLLDMEQPTSSSELWKVISLEGQTFAVPAPGAVTIVVGGTTLRVLGGESTVPGSETLVFPGDVTQKSGSASLSRKTAILADVAPSRISSDVHELGSATVPGSHDSDQHSDGAKMRVSSFWSLIGIVMMHVILPVS